MKVPITMLVLLMAAASAFAQHYEISSMQTGQQYACINNAWIRGAPCVEVSLRVTEDIGANQPMIKAYFFGKDREPVLECTRPTSVSFGDGQSKSVPDVFKPGKKNTVYFGIPANIQRGKAKWKYCVVVFGDKDSVTAAVYPKDDIQQFKFKEKDQLGKKPASK